MVRVIVDTRKQVMNRSLLTQLSQSRCSQSLNWSSLGRFYAGHESQACSMFAPKTLCFSSSISAAASAVRSRGHFCYCCRFCCCCRRCSPARLTRCHGWTRSRFASAASARRGHTADQFASGAPCRASQHTTARFPLVFSPSPSLRGCPTEPACDDTAAPPLQDFAKIQSGWSPN